MHRPKPGVGFRPPQMKVRDNLLNFYLIFWHFRFDFLTKFWQAGVGNFKPPTSSQGSSGFKAPTPLFTQETSSQDSQNGNVAMHTEVSLTEPSKTRFFCSNLKHSTRILLLSHHRKMDNHTISTHNPPKWSRGFFVSITDFSWASQTFQPIFTT